MVNSCFEDLEGRVGLKRVEVCSKGGGKKRNERVKVSSDFVGASLLPEFSY